MRTNLILIDGNKMDMLFSKKVLSNLLPDSNIKVFDRTDDVWSFFSKESDVLTEYGICIPNIILMDVNIPEMSEFEFLEKLNALKAANNQTKVYLLSSTQSIHNAGYLQKLYHCSGYISKPLNENKINRILFDFKPYLNEYDYGDCDINLDLVN
ncbi:response regulator [Flavivirga sp. 57AJ16]|uniref:response regulator n=1 Tax=Flavivirga sp. 57AJ16 TaxID=3025307 RepID=UPI002366B268|nr:response regulator [Flavivirga sp. 57AJ16]MDD7886960.1 response regulator [Flavivirga sp. 57AJ16]